MIVLVANSSALFILLDERKRRLIMQLDAAFAMRSAQLVGTMTTTSLSGQIGLRHLMIDSV